MTWLPLSLGITAAILGCSALALSSQRSVDFLSTARLLCLYFLLAYVADPIMIGVVGRFGFDAKHWWWTGSTGAWELGVVSLLGGLFALSIAAGFHVAPSTQFIRFIHIQESRRLQHGRLAVALIFCGTVSVGSLIAAFSAQLSTVEGVVALIGYKQSVFAGRGYLLFLALLFKGVVLLWTVDLFRNKHSTRATWTAWWTSVVVMAVIDIATGTRSNLLFANVLVLVHLWHKLRRPFRLRTLLAGAVTVLLAAVAIRVVTRDISFSENRGRSVPEIVQAELSGIAENVLFDEVQGADAQLLVLMQQLNRPPLFSGMTIAAALVAPIPRSIFPTKPRGGNAEFTAWYFPSRYQETKVEYAVSLLTELWINGRIPLVILGGVLLGVLCARIDHAAEGASHPVVIALQSVFLWRTISLVRGDVFNWTINIIMIAVAIGFAYLATSARPQRIVQPVDSRH